VSRDLEADWLGGTPAPEQRPGMVTGTAISVSELNRRVGNLLERSFPLCWVAGEISNLTRAASGHWYFVLKDRDAQVRCVMFRSRNQLVAGPLQNGDRVEVRALAGLYAARGEFQLTVEQVRRAGAGALYEAFLRLKEKLAAEGAFEPARKRRLPAHPRVIAVVTSPQAAALRDVLTTLTRRAPHVRVILYPAPVQGNEAPARLIQALREVASRVDVDAVDLVLLVRGGGSLEDLMAFNDEGLARQVLAMPVPVVSGVGHETDFTITDFVADLRAPTPTAAAELATPDRRQLLAALDSMHQRLAGGWLRRWRFAEQRFDDVVRRLRSPRQILEEANRRVESARQRLPRALSHGVFRHAHRLSSLAVRLRQGRPDVAGRAREVVEQQSRMNAAVQGMLSARTARLELLAERLRLLDPSHALARGYAIATDSAGAIIRDAAHLRPGQEVQLALARGRASLEVRTIYPVQASAEQSEEPADRSSGKPRNGGAV